MVQSKDRLTKAGDYNLETAEILSYKITGGAPGQQQPYRVDIQNIIIAIELQEGIFNHTMVGRIQVYDTKDVRTLLPIVGLERLNLKFSTCRQWETRGERRAKFSRQLSTDANDGENLPYWEYSYS